jgi:hypothetical protein
LSISGAFFRKIGFATPSLLACSEPFFVRPKT